MITRRLTRLRHPCVSAALALPAHRRFSAHSSPMNFSLIVAATQRGGIGLKGDLPWSRQLSGDLAHFKKLTTAVHTDASVNETKEESVTSAGSSASKVNAVIMGRRTWLSIPSKFRPLPDRLNVIISRVEAESLRDSLSETNIVVASGLNEALAMLASPPYIDSINRVFVIGGASLINQSLSHPSLTDIHLTQVLRDFDCDTHIDINIPLTVFELASVGDVKVDNGIPYQFLHYRRRASNLEEMQYIDLVRHVIANGNVKGDRTGTGTRSVFGAHMRFSLTHTFPLLTTKRVFWRGVVEELLWLVRGSTDSKLLADRSVHIWDDNGSRQFLDKLGFTEREVGDLGPIYGHQWRHFNAEYADCHTDYRGQGVDQLANIIQSIKTNPNDRRMVMSAWNPCQLSSMALPPCHILCQFYVHEARLSCQMYQRSCDLGLGVPFNIASYSLLTLMVAHVTGLQPGEFVYCLGDAHVYENHVEPLLLQCQREPRAFPQVKIRRQVSDIDSFSAEDFELAGYHPYETIKMKMAV